MSPQFDAKGNILNPNEFNKENANRYANRLKFRKQAQQSVRKAAKAPYNYNTFTPMMKSNMDPFKPRPKIERTPMIHNNNYFKSSTGNAFIQQPSHPRTVAQSP